MCRNLLIFLTLSFLLTENILAQDNLYYANFSVIRSDIHGSTTIQEAERLRNIDSNFAKTGYLFSIGRIQKIWKRIQVDVSINYQERLPLEKFVFSTPDPAAGTNGQVTLAKIPTSPQSSNWDSKLYNRLLNFKYGHIEFIPTYTFGNRFRCSLGIGVFYGRLLNQKQLFFSEEDFPAFDFIFQSPFNASGYVSYRKQDVGWIPKVRIMYKINQQVKLGLSTKAYVSEYSLKANPEGTSNWGRNSTTTWNVLTFGLDLYLRLPKRKGN